MTIMIKNILIWILFHSDNGKEIKTTALIKSKYLVQNKNSSNDKNEEETRELEKNSSSSSSENNSNNEDRENYPVM